MILNSSSYDGSSESTTLNTYDDAKQLALRPGPANEYNMDLQFSLAVASPTVQASTSFQLSPSRLSSFLEQSDQDEVTLHDENGDGLIKIVRVDALGHYQVSIEVGGPWSDKAQISFHTD